MSKVELCNLSKQYGEQSVVEDFNLEVDEGELIVLLGPSGCGKTSTLRMVAGLETITTGELYFDDRLMNDVPPDRRNVGMVFQNYALYPHMTVFNNLAFGLESQPKTANKAERRQSIFQRVTETAKLLEIEHLLGQRPRQLSGGQRQRVALGRALVRRPDVFLMDEPLSNLDANLRDRMRMELAQLHEIHGITTLYVTHDQGEALTLADRIVVMNKGRVAQVGTPGDIYERPADSFVANFVGTPGMNLWQSDWQSTDAGLRCGPAITLDRQFAGTLESTTPSITVGVRPEHLARVELIESPGVTIACRIELVERLGSHLLAHCSLAHEAGSATRSMFVARLDSESELARGDELVLAAASERVHLFAFDSGKRIEHHRTISVSA